MKQTVFLLVLLVATHAYGLDAGIRVSRTATARQIKAVKRQVLERYGIRVDINVVSRNKEKEITNLTFVRYDKSGAKGGSCSSDTFGLLIITPEGCKIADFGHERQIE